MRWHAHPDVWALVLLLGGGYLWAMRRLAPEGQSATRGQRAAFLLGVLSIWLAADWPMHELAEDHLLSVHMVQHTLISLVAPPLLLLGTPGWLARRLLRPAWVMRWARRVSRPLVAFILFNATVAFTHWRLVMGAALGSEPVHLGLHALLFGTSLVMWMPVVSPLLEIRRLPYPGQMMYLFAQSILPTIPASFLTFGDTVIYPAYDGAFGLDAITDQRIAGLFMKIVGGLILWAVIAVLFFRWHRQETTEGTDALAWRDVDRELDRVEVTR